MPRRGSSRPALTLTQALAERGYGHRETSSTATSGKREIYIVATGEVVGQMTAQEGWDWLRQHREAAA